MDTSPIARFFDGKSNQAFNAELNLGEEMLTIRIQRQQKQTESFTWNYHDLYLISRLKGKKPAVIQSARFQHARLQVYDNTLYQQIRYHIPKNHYPKGEISLSWLKIILIMLVCFGIFVGALFGIPAAAPLAARLIPFAWEDKLGKTTIQQIVPPQRQQCVAPDGLKALDKMTSALSQAASVPIEFDVRVIDDAETPNAFAVPGHHIVILQGLISLTDDPDELAGVLAHEMGHVIGYHTTAGIISQLGYRALLVGAFGISMDVAPAILGLQYTRHNEREADAIGTGLLYQVNVDPAKFAQFFEKLNAAYPEPMRRGIKKYLATHPMLIERIQTARQKPVPAKPTPILNDNEWRALKNICAQKKPLSYD